MKKIGWKNYVLSILLVLLCIVGAFKLKLFLGYDVSIYLKSVCIGAVLALFFAGILLKLKKNKALLLSSILLLIIWFIAKGDSIISSAIFSAGAVGTLCSVPLIALLLSRISE